jgi:hypothetical protein
VATKWSRNSEQGLKRKPEYSKDEGAGCDAEDPDNESASGITNGSEIGDEDPPRPEKTTSDIIHSDFRWLAPVTGAG